MNAGLAALGEKPFEYLTLRVDPAPWKPEDSILVVHAMFFELNDERGRRDSELGYLHDTLPPADVRVPDGARHGVGRASRGSGVRDAADPRAGGLRSAQTAGRPDLPKPLSFRRGWRVRWVAARSPRQQQLGGGGHRTRRTAAPCVANDMHLGIRVPNTWYRASLVRPDAAGEPLASPA